MEKREGKAENGWDARTGYLFGPDARGSASLEWGASSKSKSPNFHTPFFRLPISSHSFFLFPVSLTSGAIAQIPYPFALSFFHILPPQV